jgi:hypothetical protein
MVDLAMMIAVYSQISQAKKVQNLHKKQKEMTIFRKSTKDEQISLMESIIVLIPTEQRIKENSCREILKRISLQLALDDEQILTTGDAYAQPNLPDPLELVKYLPSMRFNSYTIDLNDAMEEYSSAVVLKTAKLMCEVIVNSLGGNQEATMVLVDKSVYVKIENGWIEGAVKEMESMSSCILILGYHPDKVSTSQWNDLNKSMLIKLQSMLAKEFVNGSCNATINQVVYSNHDNEIDEITNTKIKG